MKIAVVTGASSGMGREFVLQISKAYPSFDEIWVIARRKDCLEELQKQVNAVLRLFSLDLTDTEELDKLRTVLAETKPHICMLVNAAGIGRSGETEAFPMEENVRMVDLNCRALTAVTTMCLPYMQQGSRIIQLASGSAFVPQPGFAIYAASKAYVLSFSLALGQELISRGITVTVVCPGPVNTPFFEAGKIRIKKVKKAFLAKPEKVVRKALFDAAEGKELSVYGTSMKLVRISGKIFPHKWMMKMMKSIFK